MAKIKRKTTKFDCDKLIIDPKGLCYLLWEILRLIFVVIEAIIYPYFAAFGMPEILEKN
jgi:hypothetical protein